MTNSRQEVYAAIDGERDYQDSKWNENTTESEGFHSATEWLVYIKDYTEEALRVCTRTPDPEARDFARHNLRKVAGLAVAAMEQLGVSTREQEGPRAIGVSR